MAPAKFAAGWYYGITGDDKRRDLRQCFAINDNLTDLLYEAMADYIEGNMESGDEKMHQTKPLLQEAMASCGQLAEEMDKITQKFDDLKGSDQWEKIAAKVYHESKDKIEVAVRMQLD